jgi:hypothetical protein
VPIPTIELQFAPAGPPMAAPRDHFASVTAASRAALLGEAVRLFDLRSVGRNRAGITKKDWPRLTFDILDKGVRLQRYATLKAVRARLHELATKPAAQFVSFYNDADENPFLPERDVTYYYNDGATRARCAVRAFLAERFRTSRFVETEKPGKGQFAGLKLELIALRLWTLRSALDAVIRDPTLTAAPSEVVVTLPIGDRGATAWLSEHLYQHAAAVPRLARPADMPPSLRQLFGVLADCDASIASLRTHPLAKAAEELSLGWLEALDELEREFLHRADAQAYRYGIGWAFVLTALLRSYLREVQLRLIAASLPIHDFYSEFGLNSNVGVCLWEALSGVPLKTPSLPSLLDIDAPTDTKYRLKYPGDHEAEDRRRAFIQRDGFSEGALMGVLGGLLSDAKRSILGSLELTESDAERPSNTAEDLEHVIGGFIARPIVRNAFPPVRKRPAPNEEKDKRPSSWTDRHVFDALTLEQFEGEAVNRNPVMLRGGAGDALAERPERPNFYAITGVEPNQVSLVNFGNTFSTQLCFFVACRVLRLVSQLFGLDAFYADQRATADGAEIKKLLRTIKGLDVSTPGDYKRFVGAKLELQRLIEFDRFVLTAGSYLHGGSFPPHRTHRDGRHFDLSMGPNLTPWRTTTLRQTLTEAWQHLQTNPFADSAKLAGALRPRITSPIYLCERSAADVGKSTLAICDHEFMRRLVDEATRKVVETEIDATDGECHPVDGDAVSAAIESLHGTPDFLTGDDAELANVGTTCLILSGVIRIVYASPIRVLRCFRSLRYGVRRLGERSLYLEEAGVADTPKLAATVDALLSCIDVAFLPSDHHHHWHVYYAALNPPTPQAKDPRRRACQERERMEVRLALLAPIWLLLNVDLGPFEGYLRHYKEHLVYADLPESRQLDEMLAFCETYAALRARRAVNAGAAPLARDCLRELFAPHVLNQDVTVSACHGIELGSTIDEPMSQAIIKKSNDIKRYVAAYREELMRLYQKNQGDLESKRLADELGIAPGRDADENHGEAEEEHPDERGFEYERWTITEQAWL